MKLPYRDAVFISKEKLTEYVLSETHAVGRFKAKFFRALGFDNTNVGLLEKSFRTIAQSQELQNVMPSGYGTKYVIDGSIKTPVGKTVSVRTVWIIEKGQKRPRFVTAYPV